MPDCQATTERLPLERTQGVEGALVDHSVIEINSLEDSDRRRMVTSVAGPAALTVAKAHKLGERLETPLRPQAKDAGDVYRLFDATAVTDMASLTKRLLSDGRSATTTVKALDYLHQLFATPRSPGIQLAHQALAGIIDEATITTSMTTYTPRPPTSHTAMKNHQSSI